MRFGEPLDEESLNVDHQIVVVSAALDDSSERIVRYLNERGLAREVLRGPGRLANHGPKSPGLQRVRTSGELVHLHDGTCCDCYRRMNCIYRGVRPGPWWMFDSRRSSLESGVVTIDRCELLDARAVQAISG